MANLTKRPRPNVTPNELQLRIFATAKGLADRRSEITLDEVDGEFWWRCCRADFVAEIQACREKLHSNQPVNWAERDSYYDAIDRMAADFGIPRTAIAAHISDNAPIAIREPAFSLHYSREALLDDRTRQEDLERGLHALESNESFRERKRSGAFWILNPERVDRVSIQVPTATMTGAEISWRFQRFLADLDRRGLYFCHPAIGSASLVHIEIELVESERNEDDVVHATVGRPEEKAVTATYGEITPPYIRVVVGFPWPLAEILEFVYDAVRQSDDRLTLTSDDTTANTRRQSPEVAIRTWAVSLLMRAGMSYREAMDLICEACSIGEIDRAGWSVQRKNLILRVPQAKPHLIPPKSRRGE